MSFAQKYRERRELNAELESVIESFETGRRQRAAWQTPDARRTALLQPLLHAVEDSWIACRDAERHYHRHAFVDTLASVGLWVFIVFVGLAPLTFLMLQMLWKKDGLVGLSLLTMTVTMASAWMHAPRIPPWNVHDRRARAVMLAAEHLLDSLRTDDTPALTERHHAALIRVLNGTTNGRSTTYNLMLAFALLRALEQVGDGRYAHRVEGLARRARGPLREAAESCLPTLRNRMKRESTFRALLRPCKPEERVDALLRSADSAYCASDQLVRPLEHLNHLENRAA